MSNCDHNVVNAMLSAKPRIDTRESTPGEI
jgi:hypothetical protein